MEIIIRRRINSLDNEIFIVRKNNQSKSTLSVINFDLDGNGIVKDISFGDGLDPKLKPSMILPEMETRQLLAAFAESAKEQGATKDDTYLKGKLEGVENHLEDMRRLVFKELN